MSIVLRLKSRLLSFRAVTSPIRKPNIAQNHEDEPAANILILTMHESPTLHEDIRHSGAKGLLTKSKAASELTPALRAILAGKTYFD